MTANDLEAYYETLNRQNDNARKFGAAIVAARAIGDREIEAAIWRVKMIVGVDDQQLRNGIALAAQEG